MTSPSTTRTVLARHPAGEGEIQLQQRQWPDGAVAYEIIANGVFLMAIYNQISERALATWALNATHADLTDDRRVLIGGLGMGFTLQAALAHDVAAVDVVEISPHIVEWNHTYFADLNGDALADPRVTLIQDDLLQLQSTLAAASYAAILLDVDNGPSWLTYEANARLYTDAALQRWAHALLPGGVFAV
ncbi:MAG: hypothetical protein KDE31_30910, partial [Caldilineaceae bacterium]|nr:hypothetical protein [Caldilineaceae bacterium]